jgi:hypothetical protein
VCREGVSNPLFGGRKAEKVKQQVASGGTTAPPELLSLHPVQAYNIVRHQSIPFAFTP